VEAFLAEHPENVVGIHCKAGKGRTGALEQAWPKPDCSYQPPLSISETPPPPRAVNPFSGLMISALLLHSGACATAEEALDLFARERTYNGKVGGI
jgi:protein-tyrosine phosphatase